MNDVEYQLWLKRGRERVMCRAITSTGRSTGIRCQCQAIRDGLCRVHLRHREQLPQAIARFEAILAEKRAQLAALQNPEPIENPS